MLQYIFCYIVKIVTDTGLVFVRAQTLREVTPRASVTLPLTFSLSTVLKCDVLPKRPSVQLAFGMLTVVFLCKSTHFRSESARCPPQCCEAQTHSFLTLQPCYELMSSLIIE